jgi:two-component system NtrC family sensor kinase
VIETLFGGQNTSRNKRQWEPEGEPQEWEISTYPIQDDLNHVVQAILLEQDVTEKRRLEATLAQSEKLAAVGQLAAGLAHEINNPLTAIIANAQLLQRELPPDDDKQELVDLINRAGGRATQVVRNLLDLARKEQYEFLPVEVNDTLDKALQLLQHEIMARSINLLWEPSEDLPAVMASKDHLQGVWINLLSNAIDALENGHNDIRITTRHQGNEVRVLIADNGKGIPPERLTRIFEPFYTTKAPGRGTGLGLSVCHRVIKQHGGRILVDSQLGLGTQFTVILPVS